MEIRSILPDDILEEILLRLPVKPLLRFKCVCKQWYALIGDYGFHKKHYQFQYTMHVAQHNDIPLFLDHTPLYTYQESSLPTKIYFLSKHQGADIVSDVTPDFERDVSAAFANDLKQSNQQSNPRLRCFGIVNGVIGLQWGYSSFPDGLYRLSRQDCNRMALWNPATREFKSIRCWPIVPAHEGTIVIHECILGFGFDLKSNDFKILVTLFVQGFDHKTGYHNKRAFHECHLYSLKANSWKLIKDGHDLLLRIYHSSMDAYLNNGVYYWVASEDDTSTHPCSIVSFNFSTDIVKEFELPGSRGTRCRYIRDTTSDRYRYILDTTSDVEPILCDCHNYEVKIGKYKEGLALFFSSIPDDPVVMVEIWEVTKFCDDDYGVPLSCRLVSRVAIHQSCVMLQVNAIRVCGDLLLTVYRGSSYEKDDLGCLYDPSTCTFNLLKFEFRSNFSYKESLFSLSLN